MVEGTGKVKGQKLELSHHFPSQAGVWPSLGKPGSWKAHVEQLLGKSNIITPNVSPPSSFRQLYLLSMASCGLKYPLGPLGSAVPEVSRPNFLYHTPCAPLAHSLVGEP